MVDLINPMGEQRDVVHLDGLPKTALQAIYHAVTGKTENMSKELKGSVLIESNDIDNLYGMLMDQLSHYERLSDPTVTVVVKHADEKTVTYSSWARFKALKVHHLDITSEVIIRIESVITLPETKTAQRCILTVSLDSALPVLDMAEKDERFNSFSWFIFLRSEWRTAKVNVDFVDFLVGKILTAVVEEWFASLQKMPKSRVTPAMFRGYEILRNLSGQSGRLGVAAFLASFAWMRRKSTIDIHQILYISSISLTIWGLSTVIRSGIVKRAQNRLGRNIIPTIILLTEGDARSYTNCRSKQTSFFTAAFSLAMTTLLSLIINIIASVIYSDWII